MILKSYVIYDIKAEVFHAPFFAISHGSAARSFADLANDTQTTIGRHPADYILYCVGSFNDASGVLHPGDREHIANAIQLVHHAVPLPLERPNGATASGLINSELIKPGNVNDGENDNG